VRKQLTESTVLFISIIKWVFLATIAGAIVGGATAIFLKILGWATGWSTISLYFLVAAHCIIPQCIVDKIL
jgi:hypothetical protein